MRNWRENLKWDALNTDPKIIVWYKRLRRNYRKQKKLIRMMLILSIASFCLSAFVEPYIGSAVWYRTILMTLNLITFIGVFYPMSIRETLSRKDVLDTIKYKQEEDRRNKEIEDRASF